MKKNDSKKATRRIESAFDESFCMMQSLLFSFPEEKSDPQRAKCLELHNN